MVSRVSQGAGSDGRSQGGREAAGGRRQNWYRLGGVCLSACVHCTHCTLHNTQLLRYENQGATHWHFKPRVNASSDDFFSLCHHFMDIMNVTVSLDHF